MYMSCSSLLIIVVECIVSMKIQFSCLDSGLSLFALLLCVLPPRTDARSYLEFERLVVEGWLT